MKFVRSTLFATATALVAAACGDKVTVTNPPTVTPAVHSVTVSPSSLTFTSTAAAQAFTLTAAISADAGATTTPVTWTSSDPSVTVTGNGATATGSVIANANPTSGSANKVASVCAAVGGQSSCGTVTVTAPTAVVPASIAISGITVGCPAPAPNPTNCGVNVPVTPTAVAGGIDIRATITPGNQAVAKAVLFMDGARTDSQVFTAAQAAALRSAADEASAAQSAPPSIIFSINTARFSATGVPSFLNGTHTIQVQLFTVSGNTPSAQVGQNLTFANADTYAATLTTTTPTTLNNALGFTYTKAGLSFTIMPVIYTVGRTVATTPAPTVSFGGCTGAPVTVALANTAGTNSWVATATGAGYEFSTGIGGCAATNATGETISGVTAQDNAGNTLFTVGTLPVNAAAAVVLSNNTALAAATRLRLDNKGPATNLTLFAAATGPGTRTNSWLNDAVVLNTVAGANGAIATAAADAGVGLAGGTPGTITYASSVGGTAMTNVTTLAESSTNTAYTLSVTGSDALGNAAAAVTKTFGVDRTAPTLTIIVGGTTVAANNSVVGAAQAGTAMSWSALDPAGAGGTVTGSGFFNLAATPLSVVIVQRTPAATTTTTTAQNLTYTIPAGVSADAYYTITTTLADQAGNVNVTAAPNTIRLFAQDATPPLVTSPLFSLGTLVGGTTVNVTGNAADNLDVWGSTAITTFGAASGGMILNGPWVASSSFNPTTFTTGPAITVPLNFLASLEVATGANVPPAAPVTPAEKPATVALYTANSFGGFGGAAAGIATSAAVAFTPANITTIAGGAIGQIAATTTWAVTTQAAGNVTLSRAGAGTTTLTAQLAGPTGTQVNPFLGGVDFYLCDNTTVNCRFAGTVSNAATVTDLGAGANGRVWSYSLTFNAGTAAAGLIPNSPNGPSAGVYQVRAVGRGLGAAPAGGVLASGQAFSTISSVGTVTVAP